MVIHGLAVGLLAGSGVALIWLSCTGDRRTPSPGGTGDRLRRVVAESGLRLLTLPRLALLTVVAAIGGFVLTVTLTRSLVLATTAAALAATAPMAWVRSRARRRVAAHREWWPDVVDHLASGVRAGLSLPEALSHLAVRGPVPMRAPFEEFARDYRASGHFGDCLDLLKARLADPVADRVIEALRLTREVGGTDLGPLLRTLSGFLRDDARLRSELVARQSWTVNGARLAVIAPWIVLLLLHSRPEAAAAFDSPAGIVIILAGGVACLVAYRVMLRIGRLPVEQRVFG